MINFEEELKKFNKSFDFDDLDEALSSVDITDMNDIMFNMLKKQQS